MRELVITEDEDKTKINVFFDHQHSQYGLLLCLLQIAIDSSFR